jgi:hypothetical protein
MAANPHPQMPRIIIETQSRVFAVEGANDTVSGNGLVNWTTADETTGVTIIRAGGAKSSWLPRLISNQNGIRNLIDALNHSQ